MLNMKREIQLKVTKPSKASESPREPRTPRMSPLEVYALTRTIAKDVVLMAGLGYAGKKLLDTSAEIAVIAARANLK